MFTPGPWKVEQNGTITSACSPAHAGEITIARNVCKDNARLIGVAPEMYRLLSDLADSQSQSYRAEEARRLVAIADGVLG